MSAGMPTWYSRIWRYFDNFVAQKLRLLGQLEAQTGVERAPHGHLNGIFKNQLSHRREDGFGDDWECQKLGH